MFRCGNDEATEGNQGLELVPVAQLGVFSAAQCLGKTELHRLVETFQKWLGCHVEWESQHWVAFRSSKLVPDCLNLNIKGCTAFGEGRVMKALENFPARNLVLHFAIGLAILGA